MHVRAPAITVALTCALIVTLGAAGGCGSTGMTELSSVPSAIPPATAPATARVPSTHMSTSDAPITVLPPPAPTDSGVSMDSDATGAGTSGSAESANTVTESTMSSTTRSPTASAPAVHTATTSATAAVSAGTVVVIDPGHNGGNAQHPEIINKPVPAGFGQTKPCNTTGTATDAGYPEHEFNWKVALDLRDLLQSKGITVVMTRDSDTGVGPCVDKRADVGNSAHAAAVISIHGDGEAAGMHGFVVMTASRAPAGPEITRGTENLAIAVRNGLAQTGFPVSTGLGTDGLWQRGDLGGLNLSLRPTVMVECGNMRNAAEAAVMTSAAGQQRYAEGLAAGVLAFLAG